MNLELMDLLTYLRQYILIYSPALNVKEADKQRNSVCLEMLDEWLDDYCGKLWLFPVSRAIPLWF